MFKITIEGETLPALAQNLLTMADQFSATVPQAVTPKTTIRKPKPQAEPQPDVTDTLNIDDEELQRELNEPVEPAPETAKSVVDAGTGQPIPPQADEELVKMTKVDVRAAAGKLAAKDAGQLATILKKYGAAKLSEVADDKLGDFASDVIEALG